MARRPAAIHGTLLIRPLTVLAPVVKKLRYDFIPPQIVPYIRLAKRVLLGPGSLPFAAQHQDILQPEETTANQPAIFLPGQLDRVTGAHPVSTLQKEIERVTSSTAVHAATIAFHIKNATLVDGSIYAGRYRHMLREKRPFDVNAQTSHHLKKAALVSSYAGAKWFGHWLSDDCVLYPLAEEFGTPLCLRLGFPHLQKYQDYFGEDWTAIDRAHIDHLVIFQDFAQNSLKRRRYETLRARIQSHFPRTGHDSFVYLKRGQSGVSRLIQNEDEIVETLVNRGFAVVDVASDPLESILGTLVNAIIVISMEGSHIAHCNFALPKGGGLLTLQPSDRFTGVHRDWSECLGSRFGFVVGPRRASGYYFSSSEILRTTDLMLSALP
jgi:hypothetical protein